MCKGLQAVWCMNQRTVSQLPRFVTGFRAGRGEVRNSCRGFCRGTLWVGSPLPSLGVDQTSIAEARLASFATYQTPWHCHWVDCVAVSVSNGTTLGSIGKAPEATFTARNIASSCCELSVCYISSCASLYTCTESIATQPKHPLYLVMHSHGIIAYM